MYTQTLVWKKRRAPWREDTSNWS